MPTLLIVDDVEEYLRSLRRALSSEWTIVCAQSIEESKHALSLGVPDVALLDVRLSEAKPENRDGLLLLKYLREQYPGVRVVMMSAYRDFDAAVEVVNLGAERFMKKPIDIRELKTALRSLVAPSS